MIDDLILHIGMPKTGTTSIQRALNTVRGGPDWTYVNLNPPHSANPVILRGHAGVSHTAGHPGPRGVQSPEAARALLDQTLRSVQTSRAVLSAEVMMRLPPAAVASLLDQLSHHARAIRAIAYIRPPISFVTSYVQQFYKTAHAPLSDVIRRAQRPVPADVALWDHVLGAEQVSIYPYVRDTFAGRSVVQHFAEVLRLGPLPEPPQNANVSLADEATRLLVQFRGQYPDRHPHDGRILARLAKLESAPFQLHPDRLLGVAEMARATREWAEMRMGWEAAEPEPRWQPRAIRDDADFHDILPSTREWLASRTGRSASTLRANPEGVADAVRDLGNPSNGQRPVGCLADRMRLA